MDRDLMLAKLMAAEEIKVLKPRYAEITDDGYEPDRVLELFTDQCAWDGGEKFGRHEGREAIRELFLGFGRQIVWALHYMIAPIVEVDDDLEHATGRWYLWQPCTFAGDDGPQAIWLADRYINRFVREDGVWKFSEVSVRAETMAPFERGWAKVPFWSG